LALDENMVAFIADCLASDSRQPAPGKTVSFFIVVSLSK